MEISVVLPSRSEEAMLWATVASARSDLDASGLQYEILPVVNDPEPPKLTGLMMSSKMCKPVFSGADSPQLARHHGAEWARGEVLFFADAHCIFPPGFFRQVLGDMREKGADLMHTAHKFIGRTFYGFKVAWDVDLWAHDTVNEPPYGNNPFRIAQAGHGAFAIRRDTYFRIGGYWQALKGWGGEEPQLNFKLWMMGGTAWLTPRTFHWHWLPPAGRRGMEMYEDRNLARNFLLVAYTYGGREYLEKVYRGFEFAHWKFQKLHPDLLEEIPNDPEVAKERAFIAERARYKSLDELRAMFFAEGVVN